MGVTLSRLGTWIVAFVVGVVYGIAGTIGQGAHVGWFPIGLVVAVIGTAAILAAVRLLTGDRWTALATGLGVMLATLLFSGPGPGGSVVVPQPPEGELSTALLWTIAVPILTAIVVAWPSFDAWPSRPGTDDTN